MYDRTLGDAMRATVVATRLNRSNDLALGTKRTSISRVDRRAQPVLRQGGLSVRSMLVQQEMLARAYRNSRLRLRRMVSKAEAK